MSFTLVSGTSNLYLVSSDGTVRTLTLPAGVTIGSGRARFAVLDSAVVIVNAPSQPIWLDRFATVRPLSLQKPIYPPVPAAGASGAYTGTRRAKLQYLIKDEEGNVIAESPWSDASASVQVSAKKIAYGSLALSPNPLVNARRLAVTADGGSEYFACIDLDDNTTTTISDDTSDASIDLFPIDDTLVAAPQRLDLIAQYRGRLVGRSPADIDTLYMSAESQIYSWPTTIPIRPTGADPYGITGFMARRTELGITRRDIIWKLIGDNDDNFELVKLVEGKGDIANDVPIVVRDIGYFLAGDGFYSWGDDGVRSLSDESVHPWFNTDDYFNRAQFANAFSAYNPQKHSILLFLCSAGSTTIDRWVEYEIGTGRWMGPHKTAAFTPTAAGVGYDTLGNRTLVVSGADGYLYYPVIGGTASDGTTSAIELDVLVNPHAGNPPNPRAHHFYGRMELFTKYQASGSLSVIPYVGDLTAAAGATIAHDLTLERERLRILGTGRLLQVRLYKSAAGQDVSAVYGYTVPCHELGVR